VIKIIIRGTTTDITFDTGLDCTAFDLLAVTFSQEGQEVLTKKITDCNIDGDKITVSLTEEETLLFSCEKNPIEMQIRAGEGKYRIASAVMITKAGRILREGCLNEI
jgi:hypothetical protein